MRKLVLIATLMTSVAGSRTLLADVYDPGSVIIPMDTTYQDSGMLKAYGLVYELLRNGVPVQWAIRTGKAYGGVDFTTSASVYPSGATVTQHGYRGGPWLIRAEDAPVALPIISAWKSANVTTVHVATVSFEAEIARRLVVAPTIAMFADGNQKIARKYMQAAGIPDSTLNKAWPDTSPDMLTPNQIAGPTSTNHSDGKLFDEDGDPVYCQLMSMHWGVTDARAKPEVVAEVRSFLGHPTHFFAECQAVNAYENDATHGRFLTPNGFLIAPKPSLVDFYNASYPFAQIDGPFKTVGGSEPAYSLPAGDSYKDTDIVMITSKGSAIGIGDVWMTGYVDGACSISDDHWEGGSHESCLEIGKVSYLGGHEYEVKLPISANPDTQGTRLFLNSLFEAPCATEEGQPEMHLTKSAPATTASAQVTFTLTYFNAGPTTALNAVLKDQLPAGASFVSASAGGVLTNGEVRWNLKNLGNDEGGTVSFTVLLGDWGNYPNQATLEYKVGLNSFTLASNTTSTLYDLDSDGDGIVDGVDTCPDDYNPQQDLASDPSNCGTCGKSCDSPHASSVCQAGVCTIDVCAPGFSDCDGQQATGCEYQNTNFAGDASNCGGCGVTCAPAHATGACLSGVCAIGSCNAGRADCNGVVGDGCEYNTGFFQSDRNHCGNCATQCDASSVCQGGSCVTSDCPGGSADCAPPSGCETDIANSATDCGGCGVLCSPPNAAGSCAGGACTVGTCHPGFSDCNGLPGDGCEYANAGFASDPNNCGACGAICAPANGVGACSAGQCVITACSAGRSDCNGSVADGCEYEQANFASDPNNCGACGALCAPAHASGACQSGHCTIVACTPGYVDLDGNPNNGCELACVPTGHPETDCNGVDDDCDGRIDEDYVRTSCGVGACSALSVCSTGVESCAPGQAGVEGPSGAPTCSDGADNDCDGVTDEDDADCAAGSGGASGGGVGAGGSAGAGTGGGAPAGAGNLGGFAGAGTGGASGSSGSTGSSAGMNGSSGNSGNSGGSQGSTAGAGNAAGTTGGGTTGGAGASAGGSPTSGPHLTDADSGDTGGCGCRLAPAPAAPTGLAWFGLLALAGLVLRRSPAPFRVRSARSSARARCRTRAPSR
jgi:uncharacterized repeat protein (TIGR01451 family)